jgi:hypothetical protein
MTQFVKSLKEWNSDTFKQSLKHEIENLDAGTLPLEHGISQGGNIDDNNITATVLNVTDETSIINSKIGIFFTEVVGGCNCNDDPVEINAYCEIIIIIDKSTANITITALHD